MSKEVNEVFSQFPRPIQTKLLYLRELILKTSKDLPEKTIIEETLKWGEPGYLTKNGSTVRLGWKKKKPNQFGIYFNCRTTLVDTYRAIYGDIFRFEGNRAIIFSLHEDIPVSELQHCIMLALTYHKRKHLPLLGA